MKRNKLTIYFFLALTLLYVAIVMFSPADPSATAKYHIDQSQIRLLTLTIVVPLVVIWLTALYGSVRIHDYSKVIKDTKEGIAFKLVSRGLLFIAFSLPANAVFGAVLSYFTVKNPNFQSTATILRNYFNIILPAAGLLTINKGASALISTLRKIRPVTWPPLTLPGIIIASSVYTWLITTRPFSAAGDTGYYLPNWIILATLSIPYLYIWCRGILAAVKFFVYKQNIRGVIYKKSLGLLATGIATIIILSVASQILITLSARLNRLNLTPILILVYVLVALNALGFGLVARGAKKLKLIEEV
ncbi:MAG: hypothetical protein JWO47_314 [Candidatus Saccharibacteria bacterium]|nr:hypothetical protein [Candidatus Saccharibacteria bacterium]